MRGTMSRGNDGVKEYTMADERARIVYCRELDPDTLLHLTPAGEDFAVRRFDGSDPYAVGTSAGEAGTRRCFVFPYDRPLDAEESSHPVSDEDWWTEHLAGLNRENLARLRED
jgi:hypothetical protein